MGRRRTRRTGPRSRRTGRSRPDATAASVRGRSGRATHPGRTTGPARLRASHQDICDTVARFYAPLWRSYQLSPTQPPTKGSGLKSGAADGALRVVGVLWPGAAITVVGDGESVVERPTRRVNIAIATSPAAPTPTDSLL